MCLKGYGRTSGNHKLNLFYTKIYITLKKIVYVAEDTSNILKCPFYGFKMRIFYRKLHESHSIPRVEFILKDKRNHYHVSLTTSLPLYNLQWH